MARAAEPERRFVSLDDFDNLDAARRQPHAGEAVEWLAPDVLAAPWWRVI